MSSHRPLREPGNPEPLARIAALEQRLAELERERDAALARAQAAEDASGAKSEFLATMSHEIRTPMTVILASLEQLREAKLPAAARSYADMAANSSERLLAVLDDILDLSRIEARKLQIREEPFEPAACIGNMVALFSLRARQKGLTLRTEIAPEVPALILGDPDRLGQVVINLVGNAIKFTDRGEVAVTAHYLRSRLEIAVRDSGIGIPADKMGLLFSSFSQIDGSRAGRSGGSGLGLAICKGIVQLMGGEIGVRSQEGVGSTFTVTLPWRPATMAENERVAEEGERGANRGVRILLAEDEAVVRELIRILLVRRGWQVELAATGREAVGLWEANSFDLILMDVQMPQLDGIGAARAIRAREAQRGGRVAIVALTAHARREDREECLAAGMDDWLTKPANMEQIYAKVEKWCHLDRA